MDPKRIHVCYPGVETMRKSFQNFTITLMPMLESLEKTRDNYREKFSPRGSNDREFEIRPYFLFVGAFAEKIYHFSYALFLKRLRKD